MTCQTCEGTGMERCAFCYGMGCDMCYAGSITCSDCVKSDDVVNIQ